LKYVSLDYCDAQMTRVTGATAQRSSLQSRSSRFRDLEAVKAGEADPGDLVYQVPSTCLKL
jgi:hypothetical protein